MQKLRINKPVDISAQKPTYTATGQLYSCTFRRIVKIVRILITPLRKDPT